MTTVLNALCVVLYSATAVLYVIAERPLVAGIWALGALVWTFTLAMEVQP